MGNLMTSFNAGVSGLQSAQASLNTASHNIANAQTKGYVRQQTLITDSFYQTMPGTHDDRIQVGTGTTIVKTRQTRNDFLDAQYRLQLGRQTFYEANQKAAHEIEDMLGELEGEEFRTCITDLKSALSSLAENPDNIVCKDQVVSVAQHFIERAQVLQQELDTYQTSLNLEVQTQVDSINDLVTQIRELNKQIQKYEATGENANDYRDKRNQALDELSKIIKIEVNENIDGTVTIYSEGAYLLDSVNQFLLTTEYESPTSHLLKPVWKTGGDFFMHEGLAYSSENNTDIGSLKGLMVARGNKLAKYTDVPNKPDEKDAQFYNEDGSFNQLAFDQASEQYRRDLEVYNDSVGASIVMQVQSQLDTLVHGIVKQINDTLCPNKELKLADGTTIKVLDEDKALMGDDGNDTIGTELFARRSTSRYEKVTVTVENEDGTTSDIEVYKLNDENKEDPYSLYTINQLVVNPVVLQDSSTIPVKYTEGSGKYGGYASNELLQIAQCFNNTLGTLNPNSLTTYNALDFYSGMCSDLAIAGGIWNGVVSNQETTVASLESERQNVMGVSTDEELSDLIKFQRCFDASSRYITTISEMLEHIIERLGNG